MEANIVAVHEKPLNAIRGNAGGAEISTVGSAHDHDGNGWNAWPHLTCDITHSLEQIGAHRGSSGFAEVAHLLHADLIIRHDFLQGAKNVFGRILRQDAAIAGEMG